MYFTDLTIDILCKKIFFYYLILSYDRFRNIGMVHGMVQCFDFNLGKFLKIGFKVCLIARFSNDGDDF